MAYDLLRLILKGLSLSFSLSGMILLQYIRATVHSWTYRAVPSPRNVVVIGGSFVGIQATMRLSRSLPTGYRVLLVERNSHFNYLFKFPRYSVIKGHEHTAFIPYDGIVRKAPHGAAEVVHDTVVGIDDSVVTLESGKQLKYDYLVLATGSTQPAPSKLLATDKAAGCAELRSWQNRVADAENIAVVGGGPVGIEIAMDVKTYYPEKQVTLVHSRAQLLPRFGPRLHRHVLIILKEKGVNVILEARPGIVEEENEKTALRFGDGQVLSFDLVIPCTGQRPNSSFLASFIPASISKETQEVTVEPTLQVPEHPNIFAIGDVAKTGGPKMARAGFFQVEVVISNIVSLIHKRKAVAQYKHHDFEGAINLTLGKDKHVIYMKDGPDNDILYETHGGGDELEVKKAWRAYGCNLKNCEKV